MSKRSWRRRKKLKKRNTRKKPASTQQESINWLDEEGIHFIQPGQPPTEEELEAMTQMYQDKIRNSPIWPEIVAQLGEEEAEKALEGCRAELRPN